MSKKSIHKKRNQTLFKGSYITKLVAFCVVVFFIFAIFHPVYAEHFNTGMARPLKERDIVWEVTLGFNEPGGCYDHVVFGEAPDANDGPPVDAYDTRKPPLQSSKPPYIRAWFDDNLPFPYNQLLKDFRQYPGTEKVWNLTVRWTPEDIIRSTDVTISWITLEINTTEYTTVNLCTQAGTILADMRLISSYTFECPAYIQQQFKITCSVINQPPYTPSNPNPVDGAVGVGVSVDLSWVGGDPDPGDVVSYDVYFGLVSPPPKVVGNQSASVFDPGMMLYSSVYYWRVVSWDDNGASAVGPVWSFTTEPRTDITPPTVSIISPKLNFLHVNIRDRILFSIRFITTFVIGKIDVTATAQDAESGIDRVEFYIQGELETVEYNPPYTWTWSDKQSLFPYTLKVVAYDNAGNFKIAEMRVWKFN